MINLTRIELIDRILKHLNSNPGRIFDISEYILREEIDCTELHRFGERQPYMIADDIGQTIVNSGLATRENGSLYAGNYQFLSLRISSQGMQIMNEYGNYSRYLRYQRNRTSVDIFKTRFWWIILIVTIILTALVTNLVNKRFNPSKDSPSQEVTCN